jgi:hypothetical protein
MRQFITDLKTGRKFIVEPISEHAYRNADWNNGLKESDKPKGGAIHPDDSIITEKTCKNITMTDGSPYSVIEKLLKST